MDDSKRQTVFFERGWVIAIVLALCFSPVTAWTQTESSPKAVEEVSQSASPKKSMLPASGVTQAENSQLPNASVGNQGTSQQPSKGSSTSDVAPSIPQPREIIVFEVEVRGNRVVSTNAILSKVKTKKGKSLRQQIINDDVRRLYGTGFFQDVRVDVQEKQDGVLVTVVVDEKPIVKRIIIEGSSAFAEDKLRKELNIVEGQILDQRAVKQGVNKIQEKYFDKGFRFAEVKSNIDVNQQAKEAVLYILIDEGDKYKINKVSFEGNESYPEKDLKRLLKTKPRMLILLRKGVFNEDTFQEDLERVRAYYQSQGFLDVQSTSKFDYNREKKEIYVTVVVGEGERYYAGDIKIKGNVLFPESEIWDQLEMLPGFPFSQSNMTGDVAAIRQYYFQKGYIGIQITPDVVLNPDTGKVDVNYNLVEGDLFFVDKVKIRGNTKTKDIVIRRELRTRPGDRFDGQKIDRSKQRLDNLGFFQEVVYDTEGGSAPNRRDVVFKVKEKQTGELSFGAGVSSIDQFVGFAEISQRNFDIKNFPRFTGGGQSLSLRGRIGTITQDIDASFVEPYLFNKNLSLGLNGFRVTREANNTDFDEIRTGVSISFARALSEFIRAGIGYTAEQVELDDLEADAGPSVRAFEGKTNLSRLKFNISRDTRDNAVAPKKGTLITSSIELIGSFIGGDEDYYNAQISFTKYFSFKENHVIEAKSRLGITDEIGGSGSGSVPVFDRFFAGGLGTVRGFEPRRVGPKEAGDAVGGNSLFILNLEYTFPLIQNFKGAVFLDVGQVAADAFSFEGGEFAASVGPGLKIATPIGPVALYYGYPIANEDTESENGRFEFSFSRGF